MSDVCVWGGGGEREGVCVHVRACMCVFHYHFIQCKSYVDRPVMNMGGYNEWSLI